jgi:hypothetical protein
MEMGRRMFIDDSRFFDRVLFARVRSLLGMHGSLFSDAHLVEVSLAVSPVLDNLYE